MSRSPLVVPLAPGLVPDEVGGKAAGLAKLLAAGLDVPHGVVVTVAALESSAGEKPSRELLAALDEAVAELRPPLVVRSSATEEDQATARAPGVFLSVRDVMPGDALRAALEAVWASRHAPTASFYLRRRGLDPATAPMAVIVQEQVRGPLGTAYTRDPSAPEEERLLVEVDTGASSPELGLVDGELARGGRLVLVPPSLSDDELRRIAVAARAAAFALGHAAADVEWVLGEDRVWLVQARPLGELPVVSTEKAFDADALAFSRAEPSTLWTWDATHNPDPLSPAQEGLVELVDAARAGALRQRVVEGYLYYTTDGAPPPSRRIEPAELRRVFDEELAPAAAHALAPLEVTAPELEIALAAYLELYRLYAGVLTPALAVARRRLPALLAPHLGAAEAVAQTARLIAGWGPPLSAAQLRDVAPEWDVATPSFAELGHAEAPRPPLAAAGTNQRQAEADATARELAEHLDEATRAALPAALAVARAAASLAEEDDLLFFRAQAGVRRALVALAQRWKVPIEHVTHLPLGAIREAASVGRAPPDLAARAEAALAERARRRNLRPPLHLRDGRPIYRAEAWAPADLAQRRDVLHGRGLGGFARGPVLLLAANQSPQAARGSVVVAATLTPAMAPLVAEAAAVVTEHGGLLGHGAALARELGIPCVVGCVGALSLRAGERVAVDGAAGLVWKIGESEKS